MPDEEVGVAGAGDLLWRRAGPGDAAAVAGLHADSWRRHYRGAYSDAYLDGDVGPDRLLVWESRLAAPDGSSATILAEDGSALVGFVHVVLDDDPEWGSLVDNLHVVHDRKRAGIGTRLMGQAARAAVDHGPGGLYLWVLERNTDAQAFYEARSGQRVGRREVAAPGGVPGRLAGTPFAFRYAWPDPEVLVPPPTQPA